jgi:hypothetical protein
MTTKHTGTISIGQREFSLYEELPLGETRPEFCIWRVVETRTGQETVLASVNALEGWFVGQQALNALRGTHDRR